MLTNSLIQEQRDGKYSLKASILKPWEREPKKAPSESNLPELIVYFGKQVLKLHPSLKCQEQLWDKWAWPGACTSGSGWEPSTRDGGLSAGRPVPSVLWQAPTRLLTPQLRFLNIWRLFRNSCIWAPPPRNSASRQEEQGVWRWSFKKLPRKSKPQRGTITGQSGWLLSKSLQQ